MSACALVLSLVALGHAPAKDATAFELAQEGNRYLGGDDAGIGEVIISGEDGKVLKSDLKAERVR